MWRTTMRSIIARRRRLFAACSAVLLGVAFLTGTLVLVRAVTTGFTDLVTTAYAGTDAEVRSSVVVGSGDFPERGLIGLSLADTVAAVDGVATATPRIEGSGRIVGADGEQVGGSGPTITGNWVEDQRLNPYDLAEGRIPAAPGEVVIDRAAADEGDLGVGDTTVVLTPDPIDVTVVGLATFGGADSQGSATYAAFTTEFAERALLPVPGMASSIAVAADPGISQVELVRQLDAVLPDGVEAITGDAFSVEIAEGAQGEDYEAFQQALLIFAIVALVVATFTIHNTFTILVAHRTRELAVLRVLGASRGQVLRAVIVEALVVGVVGSVAGIVAGLGLALGLIALMDRLDLAVPPVASGLDVTTIVAALAVGVVTSLLASLAPAIRASHVAPLAALRDVAVDRSATSPGRAVVGAVMTGIGAVASIVGARSGAAAVTALAALVTLVGVVVLGPVVARPAAAMLGAPLAAGGISGVLARRNAMRNPRRTAATATSLLIGVAVVTSFTVIAASLLQSIEDSVSRQFAGDLVIVGEGSGGLSTELAPAVAALPEVLAASPIGTAPIRINGIDTGATTIDPGSIEAVTGIDVQQGSLQELRADEVAVDVRYADEHELALGDVVTVEYPDGVTEQLSVGAVFGNGDVVAGTGIALPRDAFLAHTSRPADLNMLIALADGVTIDEGEAAVRQVADEFDAPDVQTNAEFTDSIAGEINVILTVVYVLLVMAIVIALMGIATTLSLSIHERTHEIGLLRAVGQTPGQIRTMVRGEAMIVALFGASGGVGLGLILARAVMTSLSGEFSVTAFTVPIIPLVVTLALAALAGVLAAVYPAHRAARMNVLAAIATE